MGFVLVIGGSLQALGAISGSKLFQLLPHFQRSERMFGRKSAVQLHAVIGLAAAVIGGLILGGVIKI